MEEDVDNDILSPDGKWMWTGSKWIPAPPTSSQSANVNLQDSVVGGMSISPKTTQKILLLLWYKPWDVWAFQDNQLLQN